MDKLFKDSILALYKAKNMRTVNEFDRHYDNLKPYSLFAFASKPVGLDFDEFGEAIESDIDETDMSDVAEQQEETEETTESATQPAVVPTAPEPQTHPSAVISEEDENDVVPKAPRKRTKPLPVDEPPTAPAEKKKPAASPVTSILEEDEADVSPEDITREQKKGKGKGTRGKKKEAPPEIMPRYDLPINEEVEAVTLATLNRYLIMSKKPPIREEQLVEKDGDNSEKAIFGRAVILFFKRISTPQEPVFDKDTLNRYKQEVINLKNDTGINFIEQYAEARATLISRIYDFIVRHTDISSKSTKVNEIVRKRNRYLKLTTLNAELKIKREKMQEFLLKAPERPEILLDNTKILPEVRKYVEGFTNLDKVKFFTKEENIKFLNGMIDKYTKDIDKNEKELAEIENNIKDEKTFNKLIEDIQVAPITVYEKRGEITPEEIDTNLYLLIKEEFFGSEKPTEETVENTILKAKDDYFISSLGPFDWNLYINKFISFMQDGYGFKAFANAEMNGTRELFKNEKPLDKNFEARYSEVLSTLLNYQKIFDKYHRYISSSKRPLAVKLRREFIEKTFSKNKEAILIPLFKVRLQRKIANIRNKKLLEENRKRVEQGLPPEAPDAAFENIPSDIAVLKNLVHPTSGESLLSAATADEVKEYLMHDDKKMFLEEYLNWINNIDNWDGFSKEEVESIKASAADSLEKAKKEIGEGTPRGRRRPGEEGKPKPKSETGEKPKGKPGRPRKEREEVVVPLGNLPVDEDLPVDENLPVDEDLPVDENLPVDEDLPVDEEGKKVKKTLDLGLEKPVAAGELARLGTEDETLDHFGYWKAIFSGFSTAAKQATAIYSKNKNSAEKADAAMEKAVNIIDDMVDRLVDAHINDEQWKAKSRIRDNVSDKTIEAFKTDLISYLDYLRYTRIGSFLTQKGLDEDDFGEIMDEYLAKEQG